MSNEMFTSLPTVSSAQMTDVICAVQGYSPPSSLGLSVQETLGQVYSLFQSNIILYNSGNPNGVVAGTTYQLCWDSVNSILYVCTTSGTASSAVWSKSIKLTAGTGISISQNANDILISSSSSGLTFVNVTSMSSVAMNTESIYYINNSSSAVTLTMPAISSPGDSLIVMGNSSLGWTIALSGGVKIQIGQDLAGTSVSSTNQYDSFEIICTEANLLWQTASGPQGNLTFVP
jgi:hypothetical protein